MQVEGFIAGHLRFKGRMAVIATAISFFVIIIAVAISTGFGSEIRNNLSAVTGDVILSASNADLLSGKYSIPEENGEYKADLLKIKGIKSITPVVYRAGIVRSGGDDANSGDIHGIVFKGIQDSLLASFGAIVPQNIAKELGAKEGDEFIAYFVSEEKTKIRKFTIKKISQDLIETEGEGIIFTHIGDLQRVNGWEEDEVSAMEIEVDGRLRSRRELRRIASETGARIGLAAVPVSESFSRIYDWLDLIDYNVYAILALMSIVAGFNMISGLLILLMQSIPMIGTLKTLGMKDRSVAGVFLMVGAKIVAVGMLLGNAAALLFCFMQSRTHLISLNPENYFVSFVPVSIDPLKVLAADAAAFALIMVLLLIPTLFISKIDPSLTVKTE